MINLFSVAHLLFHPPARNVLCEPFYPIVSDCLLTRVLMPETSKPKRLSDTSLLSIHTARYAQVTPLRAVNAIRNRDRETPVIGRRHRAHLLGTIAMEVSI